MNNEANILTKITKLEDLPLDNYRVFQDVFTDFVEAQFILNRKLSGIFVIGNEENNQVIGIISRAKFFEEMSKEYARDIYSKRPIKLLIDNFDYQPLKIPHLTDINEAVNLAVNRPPKYIYEPIVVTKNEQEIGIVELSLLILSQAKIVTSANQKLSQQDKHLRIYANNLAQEKETTAQYANQLEQQQQQLEERNKLLETQTEILQQQKATLEEQQAKIIKLNQGFAQVGSLLSQEGKITFQNLADSVNLIINFAEKIEQIAENFQEKFTTVKKSTNLISKISKKVESLSFQAATMAVHLPSDDLRGLSFNMIVEEIKKLSNQISEANTSINEIAANLSPEIQILKETSEDSKEVIQSLNSSSQKTKNALNSLENLVNQASTNESNS